MKAHACIQQERRAAQGRRDHLEGAIVDRETLLIDLGHILFDLRCRGAARRDAERAFAAAHAACEVADEVDVFETNGAFSGAATRFLRGVVAWWHMRPLVARCIGAAAPMRRAA